MMDYGTAKAKEDPMGSAAMESVCWQDQCRFKRPGHIWSQVGDEALLCLETFCATTAGTCSSHTPDTQFLSKTDLCLH